MPLKTSELKVYNIESVNFLPSVGGILASYIYYFFVKIFGFGSLLNSQEDLVFLYKPVLL